MFENRNLLISNHPSRNTKSVRDRHFVPPYLYNPNPLLALELPIQAMWCVDPNPGNAGKACPFVRHHESTTSCGCRVAQTGRELDRNAPLCNLELGVRSDWEESGITVKDATCVDFKQWLCCLLFSLYKYTHRMIRVTSNLAFSNQIRPSHEAELPPTPLPKEWRAWFPSHPKEYARAYEKTSGSQKKLWVWKWRNDLFSINPPRVAILW